jgi:lysophospholipase L1-like esterase
MRRGLPMKRAVFLFGLVAIIAAPCFGQAVSGTTFEDRNGDGIRNPGEPAIPGVSVTLFGTRDVGGALEQSVTTAADGTFAVTPGNGCYLLGAADPPGWRLSLTRSDSVVDTTSGYTFPVGIPRFAKFDHAIAGLKSGSYRYTAMGDSISTNFNLCGAPETFWYSKRLRDRLACTAPTSTVTLDQAGVISTHTDDLLVDDNADLNNVFRVVELSPAPKLITISMIGNDLKDLSPTGTPTQAQINRAVDEILDSRQNLQEAISTLLSRIPGVDVSLNSLYDNLADTCYTTDSSPFHRQWLPIVNRILRDLAWGQARRASINEVAAEFSHENQNVQCTGFDQMICHFLGLDEIHPNNNGYSILREKVWEAAGGVNLGPKDGTGRISIAGADYGYLKRVRRVFPSTYQTVNGGTVANGAAAFDDADSGATASIQLGLGQEEFRLSGFPDFYDEDQIVKVVAGVRYRTSGTVTDDFYRIEASPTGTFRPPPGYAYTTTNWNFYTPLVGGGGPNAPASNSDYPTEKLLAFPNVATLREVTSTLTKNPVLVPGAGEYDWPAITRADLATTTFRVASAPVANTAGNDLYEVELDVAYLDLYGWQKTRPPEVTGLQESRLADGTIEFSFDAVAAAQRYNLYVGRLATLRSNAYDHGIGAPTAPACAAATADAGGGRRKIAVAPAQQPGEDVYVLITAHVDDVESPSGTRSDTAEIDRRQSICN